MLRHTNAPEYRRSRMEKLDWFTKLLCKLFKYKELGWKNIGEIFFRWTIVSTPWGKLYLHRLDAPIWHEQCHNHPWDFLAIILRGGYWEKITNRNHNVGLRCPYNKNVYWRRPGSILYRPATFAHNVITLIDKPNWSLVWVSRKKCDWGMVSCET